MSWLKRVTDLLKHPPAPAEAKPPVAPPDPVAPPVAVQPSAPLPTPKAAKPSSRPAAALLVAQAAAAKAAAEAVRREQAAASARQILSSIGVHVPAPAARPAPPVALLSPQRKELITEAMRHWAHGHQIYERLDPGLKERVRAIAERMAPK